MKSPVIRLASPSTTAMPAKKRHACQRGAVQRAACQTLEDRCLFSFTAAVPYATGGGSQSVLTADFNGDSRLDMAVLNTQSSSVSVLRGNGDGTFQTAVSYSAGAGARSLTVGDFNADSRPDLATINDSGVGVMLNNGSGAFPTSASIAISDARSVAVGDFNGDGKLDLVAVSRFYQSGYWAGYGYYPGFYVSSATVLIGNGTGSFTTAGTSQIGNATFGSVAVADFNGDGKQDVAAASSESYALQVLFGTASGVLTVPTYIATSSNSSVTAGDVNGDGKADLVATSVWSPGAYVMLGNGTGGFGTAEYNSTGASPVSAAIADFNSDGKADIITANSGDSSISVLLGQGTAMFRPPINLSMSQAPVAIAVGDLNGDGRADAATAGGGANSVSVLLNDGSWPASNAPRISVSDVTVTEGNTGSVNANFTVTLSAAYTQTVTVKYATADGSASAAAGDYQATSGTLTFAPGETSKTISVPVNGDRIAEEDEWFLVRLTDPTNAFLLDGSGLATIHDNEPRISIDYAATVTEGNTGTRPLNFTVRLSSACDVPVSVNYSTYDGDTDWIPGSGYYYYPAPPAATAGADYQANSGTLTFAPGETEKIIAVQVIGDHLPEPDEVLSLNLSNASGGGAVLAYSHGVGTIHDDEPYVTIADSTITEGNSGTANMTFTATLNGTTDVPVTVSYKTTDGYATAGSDYQATSGTITFAPGVTTQTITVAVIGDRIGESSEYFTIDVTGVTNAHAPWGPAYGYITDNEPQISIVDSSVIEGNTGTKLMVFTVSLSAASDQTVTVKYATGDGSATVANNDYIAASGTLTFAAGQTTKTISVSIKGDKNKEQDEYFYVLLSNASTNSLISRGTAWGDIVNDDKQGASSGKSK